MKAQLLAVLVVFAAAATALLVGGISTSPSIW